MGPSRLKHAREQQINDLLSEISRVEYDHKRTQDPVSFLQVTALREQLRSLIFQKEKVQLAKC